MITNITGISWLAGLSAAISTKSAQDWGAKNYPAIGVTMQRGYLILVCCAIVPLAAIWLSAKYVLEAVGQHPEVARLVGLYASIRLPGIFFVAMNVVLSRTLSSLSNMRINLTMSVVVAVVNVALSFILIPRFGFIGAPITATVCDVVECIGILIMALRDKDFQKCWTGFSRAAWSDWGPFLRISCPALVLMGIEWWTWDLQNFLSGFISPLAQATQAVAPNITDLQYATGQALGCAASTVIGNLFGEGKMRAARRSAQLVMLVCLVFMAIQGILFFVLRTHVANIFTSDPKILARIAGLLPLTLVFSFLDSHQSALTGIIQAAGRQYLGAPLVFVCYWLVGVPLGICLALGAAGLPRWGLEGLWVGMLVAVIGHVASFTIAVCRLDWRKVTIEVVERTREEQAKSMSAHGTSLSPMEETLCAAAPAAPLGGSSDATDATPA